MRFLILEDEIDFYPRKAMKEILKHHDLTIAKNVDEAKRLFTPPYDVMLLDHDMRGFHDNSDYHNTGFQFCVWLVSQNHPKVPVHIHSQNSVGKRNMSVLLMKNGWNVKEHYFGSEYKEFLIHTYGINT